MKISMTLLSAGAVLSISLLAACSPQSPSAGIGASSGGSNSGAGASDPGGDGDAGGGTTSTGGGDVNGGEPIVITPGSYALPPPDQCINKYDLQEDGCVPGDASSLCGGKCTPPSAGHNEGKTGELGYMCPRNMMFSGVMEQAALDDAKTYGWSDGSSSPFNYAVVGHDNDGGNLDGPNGQSVCCQCYQLVPYMPEQQVTVDGAGAQPTIALPKPLVVQAFNTGATPDSFDIYMAAGGTGAVKGCFDEPNGQPFYSAYPTSVGQPSDGGVKPVGNPGNNTACKNEYSLVTQQSLASAGCQSWVAEGCNQIVHDQAWITEQARDSCVRLNQPENLYHLNWKVYAKRVACPAAITQVSGCKLVEELPAADPTITADTALANGFVDGYHTTTMEDCAKPTCAARNWVNGQQSAVPHQVDGSYNSFYTCNAAGEPWTVPE